MSDSQFTGQPSLIADAAVGIVQAITVTGAGAALQVAGSSALSGLTGSGYLTVSQSPNATNPAYVGLTGVTGASNGFAVWPGQGRTVRYSDLTTPYVFLASGDICALIVER